MALNWRTVTIITVVALLSIAIFSFLLIDLSDKSRSDGTIASFTATSYDGSPVSLMNGSGHITVVHITQFEIPMCIGCEEYIIGQIDEIEALAARGVPDVDVITINIRKNPYSIEGWRMAIDNLDTNITWGWIEEVSEYPLSDRFIEYTTVDGGMANPTIIILDQFLKVVDVTHVYSISTGRLEGVQTSEAILSRIADIRSGQYVGYEESPTDNEALTFGGMLALGIITSFSPCSIALLMAMISYIGSMNERGRGTLDLKGRLTQGLGVGTAFTFGMALIFLVVGLFVSYIGEFVRLSPVFYLITGAVLVILGLNSIKPLREILTSIRMMVANDVEKEAIDLKGENGGILEGGRKMILHIGERSKYLASFLLGVLFSIGWAPCALSLVFPVLILIMSQDVSLLTGGALMFVFGLGHGLVIIPFCVATEEMKGRIGNRYIKAGMWIKVFFGAIVIVLGVLFAARYFGYALW